MRSNNVSNVRYHLSCALVKGGDTFLGNVLILFDLKNKTPDDPNNGMLFIDYKGRSVKTFRINGVYVLDERVYNSQRLYVPSELQREGANTIEIMFES